MDKKKSSVGGILLIIIVGIFIAFSNRSANLGSNDGVSDYSHKLDTSVNDSDSHDNDANDSNIVNSTVEDYTFRKPEYLTEHFEKHGYETGCKSEQDYLSAANRVINNPDALHKNEAEDGDDIYFIKSTNEIVFVSTDGYIRTYFICSGLDYYNRQ